MKSGALLKALLCASLAASLWSCSGAMRCDGLKTPGTVGLSEPVQRVEPSGAADLSKRPFRDLREAYQVLDSYEKRLPQDREMRSAALAQLARLCFIMGEYGEKRESAKYFEKGSQYARLLCEENPRRVEGHYWLALNLAGSAEAGGAGRGLMLVPAIVEALQAALAIDEAYDQAGPHRILGRVYCEAPCWPLSEGDINKSLQHLRAAVGIAPANSTNHLYLAETLMQLGKSEEAYKELERALASCHAIWPHNPGDDHDQALRLMRQFENSEKDVPVGNGRDHGSTGECNEKNQ